MPLAKPTSGGTEAEQYATVSRASACFVTRPACFTLFVDVVSHLRVSRTEPLHTSESHAQSPPRPAACPCQRGVAQASECILIAFLVSQWNVAFRPKAPFAMRTNEDH